MIDPKRLVVYMELGLASIATAYLLVQFISTVF